MKTSAVVILLLSGFYFSCDISPFGNGTCDTLDDCVGDLDLNTFYFMGTHIRERDIRYIQNYLNQANSFSIYESNAKIVFQQDSFNLDINLKCDSVTSYFPLCDSIDYVQGRNIHSAKTNIIIGTVIYKNSLTNIAKNRELPIRNKYSNLIQFSSIVLFGVHIFIYSKVYIL